MNKCVAKYNLGVYGIYNIWGVAFQKVDLRINVLTKLLIDRNKMMNHSIDFLENLHECNTEIHPMAADTVVSKIVYIYQPILNETVDRTQFLIILHIQNDTDDHILKICTAHSTIYFSLLYMHFL